MPTEPQTVTLYLEDGEPIVFRDQRIVALLKKLAQAADAIAAMECGQVTIHVGRRPRDINVIVPERF